MLKGGGNVGSVPTSKRPCPTHKNQTFVLFSHCAYRRTPAWEECWHRVGNATRSRDVCIRDWRRWRTEERREASRRKNPERLRQTAAPVRLPVDWINSWLDWNTATMFRPIRHTNLQLIIAQYLDYLGHPKVTVTGKRLGDKPSLQWGQHSSMWSTIFRCHNSVAHWPIPIKFNTMFYYCLLIVVPIEFASYKIKRWLFNTSRSAFRNIGSRALSRIRCSFFEQWGGYCHGYRLCHLLPSPLTRSPWLLNFSSRA